MARQYIGARYVPIIFDNAGSSDWVSGIAYEPLTIVTYLNNSFTSKKTVPSNIGDPASNPDYWVNTGNYNAQVATYQQEVQDLKDLVQKREIVVIGDSYAAGYGGSNGAAYYLNNIKDPSWNIYDGSYGGTGFATPGQTFDDLLTNVIGTIPDTDLVTDVFILGGYNDAKAILDGDATTTQIRSAMYQLINRIETEFPNIFRIYVGFAAFTLNNPSMITHLSSAQDCYRECNRRTNKCAYAPIDNVLLSNAPSFTDGDHHPTNAGAFALAAQMKNVLCGCPVDMNETFTCKVATSSYVPTNTGFNYFWCNNGMAYFKQGNVSFTNATAVTAGTQEIDLIDALDYTAIYRSSTNTEKIPISDLQVGTTHYTDCYLRLEEKKVVLGAVNGLPAIAVGATVKINRSSKMIPMMNM